jgi:hypothetical protein
MTTPHYPFDIENSIVIDGRLWTYTGKDWVTQNLVCPDMYIHRMSPVYVVDKPLSPHEFLAINEIVRHWRDTHKNDDNNTL